MSDIAATLETLLLDSPSGYARIVKTIRRTLEDGEQAGYPWRRLTGGLPSGSASY